MTQLTLPLQVRYPLPPEVASWWSKWKSRAPVIARRDWLSFTIAVLQEVADD